MGENKEKEIQEKFYLYQVLTEQQKLFGEQLVLIGQGMEDSLVTESVIKELKNKKGTEIMASLGKECYVRAEIKDNNVLVDLGAGVLAKKSAEEALGILESRRNELEKNRKELMERLEKISSQIAKLEPEIQRILGQEKG